MVVTLRDALNDLPYSLGDYPDMPRNGYNVIPLY